MRNIRDEEKVSEAALAPARQAGQIKELECRCVCTVLPLQPLELILTLELR